jgi:hypothetical protein
MVYGYLTECIEETLYDFWMRVGKITRCDSYWDWQNEVEEMYDWQMLDKYCRELNPNCCCTDLHWANIGYLRGVLVAIDFSGLIYGMD